MGFFNGLTTARGCRIFDPASMRKNPVNISSVLCYAEGDRRMGRESSMDDIRLAMIGTALDFIETHLEDGVALADVARSAHYSKYTFIGHFRVFWA